MFIVSRVSLYVGGDWVRVQCVGIGLFWGGEYCRMHGVCREVRPGRDVKVPKKVKKPKKIQPEHNHQIDEIGVGGCPLCDTHGDVWDPKLPECNFEGNEVTFESC